MENQTNNMDKKERPVAISRRQLIGETPMVVNEIADGCLYSGFFGTLDSARIKKVIDVILKHVEQSDHDILIADLSNVDIIDSAIAGQLIRLNKLLLLVGMEVIFCGIKPVVAQSMISAGVDLKNMKVVKNLKRALGLVYQKQGLALVPIREG